MQWVWAPGPEEERQPGSSGSDLSSGPAVYLSAASDTQSAAVTPPHPT